ncbi:MAG TPA: nickel pincer cofactor biosynthesis protein LarC [Anaerovoracaceae bacterium]|nr:nickel pincer cofactor biosynthesis protein LarC [Anaerovoracaceae bacterium]
MERILYFDCFAGISGDMSIGALIDLGLDSSAVLEEIKKLGVKGYDIEIKKINRFSISGTDVKVTLNGDVDCVHEHEHGSPDHGDGHGHDHHHDEKERSLADISHIIRTSSISEKAKELSIAIFTEIAKAEAAVHGTRMEEIYFHEVGAIDSIVDIAGTAICIDMLKADRIFCSPVHEGQGFINCKHGRLPVPVPAVIKMLGGSGISIVTEDIQAELVTPTGFGILKTVSESCGKMPEMLVESVGYGFGKTETGRLNALRVILGTSGKPDQEPIQDKMPDQVTDTVRDKVTLIETNIDNTTGEMLGFAMHKLMKAGALDAYFTPIQMKKNRPAVMLSVLCKTNDTEMLSDVIFSETSTIGIRMQEMERITLKREIRTVHTNLGEVRVKLVIVRGLERIQPEYEDCARIAEENNLSFNEVYEIVKRCHHGKEFSKNI